MTQIDRRRLLQLAGSSAAATALQSSIARALAIPAHNPTGTIQDVGHVVILMQENRSFDHFFGSLSGVRGFSDPRPITLGDGNPTWYQPNGSSYTLPFHPTAANLGLQFIADLPHDWASTHVAFNGGRCDQWIAAKSDICMAYLTRDDIPFHYALADAFTICDAYHCSLLGPTDPNRYHLFTGWVGNDGTGGGPALDNNGTEYSWTTYPEQLQAAGITWKVYQDIGIGLGASGQWGWDIADPLAGNFGDNPLVYFTQYQNAQQGSPLQQNALTGTNVQAGGTLYDELIADITAGTLPQVSWVVAPEALSEHPNWPANYGAWYVSQVLDALTANPAVWSKTVLFICYDENDGFFDHMVPPTPPTGHGLGKSTVSTTLEQFPGNANFAAGVIGLGVRVPMLVVSPWSKGGYVNSQLFDHTSVIRFLEQRFGPGNPNLTEANITPWRRAVTGDLTTAFNFATPNDKVVQLPDTSGYIPPNGNRQPNYTPTPPTNQTMPVQEPGQRLARPLPYAFNANAQRFGVGMLQINFTNTGQAGMVFDVRTGANAFAPRTYTLASGTTLYDLWNFSGLNLTKYDFAVRGPNGFLRQFTGTLAEGATADLLITSQYDTKGQGLITRIFNDGAANYTVTAINNYSGEQATQIIAPGGTYKHEWKTAPQAGWYDVLITVDADPQFAWRLSGHLENGRHSLTDPGINANT